jgi:glycosyltransferase involved in cell wall biosynthesis
VRVALAITTFERPDALAAVLRTAIDQRIAADEIWVADDGSGDATRAVVEQFARLGPVRHVRQEHAGFRLTRLRNLAIAATAADYLIFIDGDMLLHPDFIDDHRRIASAGAFTQGVRILLDDGATRIALDAAQRGANPLDAKPQGHGLRKLYGVHAPAMQRIARHAANTVIAIKGCNQGFWRRDLERVNGFNEAIEGWGPEDKELCCSAGSRGTCTMPLPHAINSQQIVRFSRTRSARRRLGASSASTRTARAARHPLRTARYRATCRILSLLLASKGKPSCPAN